MEGKNSKQPSLLHTATTLDMARSVTTQHAFAHNPWTSAPDSTATRANSYHRARLGLCCSFIRDTHIAHARC